MQYGPHALSTMVALIAFGPDAGAADPANRTLVFDTRLETERDGEALRLTSVQVRTDAHEAGSVRQVPVGELLMPDIVGYALAASGNPILFGIPPAAAAPAAARSALLTDDVLNSGIFNIAADQVGLGVRFANGLINGAGPDLILAEISADVGAESAAAPGIPAPGGDRFAVTWREAGRTSTHIVEPGDYVAHGLLGKIANHAIEGDEPPRSLAALDTVAASWRATIDYMHLYVVAIDLSDLGVPAGDAIETLELRAMPIEASGGTGDYAAGERYFYLDPMLIAGLPPA